MLTIPTTRPWVPLRILSLGLNRAKVVQADVFLLTDHKPNLLAGGRGLSLDRSDPASASLLSDLRIDKGMSWVPRAMWFTFLRLHVPAGRLDYDLAASVNPDAVPSLADAGVTASRAHLIGARTRRVWWPLGAAAGVGLATFAVGGIFGRRRPAFPRAPA